MGTNSISIPEILVGHITYQALQIWYELLYSSGLQVFVSYKVAISFIEEDPSFLEEISRLNLELEEGINAEYYGDKVNAYFKDWKPDNHPVLKKQMGIDSGSKVESEISDLLADSSDNMEETEYPPEGDYFH